MENENKTTELEEVKETEEAKVEPTEEAQPVEEVEPITYSSKYLDRAINSWIESLDQEQRERFTLIIFNELDKFETQDFTTFFLKIFKQIKPICKAYIHLNKEDKKLVNHVVRKLVRNLIKPEKKKVQ